VNYPRGWTSGRAGASGSADMRSAAVLATAVTHLMVDALRRFPGDCPGAGGSRLLQRDIDKRRPVRRLLLSLVLDRARG
jgi:hypothetical protein